MRLTVVSTFFPLPQDRGDPVRVLMILKAIAGLRPYQLLVVRREDTAAEHVAELRRLLPDVDVVDFEPTPYRLGHLGPLGRFPEASAAGLPPWIRTRYSRPLHEHLRRSAGAAIAIGEAAGAYFPGTPLRWHWDKANVLAASTRQDIAEAPTRAHRLRARYIAGVSTRFETGALALASTVSVTGDAESARLTTCFGRSADLVLPSCVALPSGPRRTPVHRHLVWLSSFSYRPNLLGLRRFLAEGWEPLRQRGFTLSLIGSGLSDEIRDELTVPDGVQVLGYVDDLRPVLATAQAAVVPVWSGAGVKLKTLTLLAHGVPVFSTTVGAEGVPPAVSVRIADTPEALAGQLIRTTPTEFEQMAGDAVQLIRDRFSEQRFGSDLVRWLAASGYLGTPGPADGPGTPDGPGAADTGGWF